MVRKLLYFFTTLLLCFSAYAITAITTVPVTQLAPSYAGVIIQDVVSCYDPTTQEMVFSWVGSDRNPYYTRGFAGPAIRIDSNYSGQAYRNVYCSYDKSRQQVVFSWVSGTNAHSGQPYYSIGGGATSAALIDSTYTQYAYGDVHCCYDDFRQQVVFSWPSSDAGTVLNAPYYAVGGGAGSATLIDPNYLAKVSSRVCCCYDESRRQVVFSWISTVGVGSPYYAVGGGAGSATLIDPNYTGKGYGDVNCCYDVSFQQVVFAWASYQTVGQPQHAPYYAVGGGAGSATLIDPNYIGQVYGGATIGGDVCCCYDRSGRQVVFSWTSNNIGAYPQAPYYAVGGGAGSATLIDPNYVTGVHANVYCSYDPSIKEDVFSFVGKPGTQHPFYAIVSLPTPTPTPTPSLLPAQKLARMVRHSNNAVQKGFITGDQSSN